MFNEELGLGIVQDIGIVVSRKAVIHGDEYGSDLGNRKICLQKSVAVFVEDRHFVVFSDAERSESVRKPVHPLFELSVIEPFVSADHGRPLRICFRRLAKKIVEHSVTQKNLTLGPNHRGIQKSFFLSGLIG